jgi:ABC-type multidrug transport system fused ATPase/permease subunit
MIKEQLEIDAQCPAIDQFDSISGDIEFKNVSFSYQNSDKKVLNNCSFKIEDNQTTALVGPPGIGKSTIVALIARFYEPTEGDIFANNKNIRTQNLSQYRKKIGYVGQNPKLFNGSIRENLLNANPDATEDQLRCVLKISRARQFVDTLPDGIDTNVGSLGIALSRGEKQRIAIARALIIKPDLIIFDDATSALDYDCEKLVLELIEKL